MSMRMRNTLFALLVAADDLRRELHEPPHVEQPGAARPIGFMRREREQIDAKRDEIIASVKKTNRVVIAEESHPICGVGAEISAEIMERAFDYLDAPVKRVSGVDVPMPYAKNLENLAIPDVNRIVAAVREVAYLD